MTRPDLDSQYTESTHKPWPAIRARPRSVFKAPLWTDLEGLQAGVIRTGKAEP